MKKFLIAVIAIIMLLSLNSCFGFIFNEPEEVVTIDETAIPPETMDELYSYYNKIDRGTTKAEVEALFGKGEVKYEGDDVELFTVYKNEKKSAGVNIIYNYDDTVSAKVLYYNKSADLVKFSNEFDEDKIPELSEKDPVAKAEELFGKGLEIGCQYNANSPTGYSKILSWFNEDGSNFQIHTNNELIQQMILNVAPDKR